MSAASPSEVYLSRLGTEVSRRTMAQCLDVLARLAGYSHAATCEWWTFDYALTSRIRADLAQHYAAATANKYLAALRGVLTEAWRLGLMDSDQQRRACDLPPVRGQAMPAGRALSGDELGRLFATVSADQRPIGKRDHAVLATLYFTGIRLAELVALDVSDYDPADHTLRITRGKGNKARVAYAVRAGPALAAWLAVRGDQPGPLFTAFGAGRYTLLMPERRMCHRSVEVIVHKRARLAGIGHVSPHDLRRSFISSLLEAGVDLALAQRLAGHTNVTTTVRYDRRPADAARAAAEKLALAF